MPTIPDMDAHLPPPPPREPERPQGRYADWQDVVPVHGPTRRPGILTAAGWILIVVGSLGLLGGAVLLSNGGGRIAGLPAQGAQVAGLVAVVIAGFEIASGVLVLGRRRGGRVMGIVFASLGLVSALLRLSASPGAAMIGLAVDGFVIFALASSGPHFQPRTRR